MTQVLALRVEQEDRAVHISSNCASTTRSSLSSVSLSGAPRAISSEHLPMAVRQRFPPLATGDIAAHADPGDRRVGCRVHGHGAHRDPAPFVAQMAQPVLRLERRARGDRMLPDAVDDRQVVGMNDLRHTIDFQLFDGLAGEGAQ